MEIRIDNLSKKFGDVVGVEDLTLYIEDGEFVAFLGPSGCGKTTTLLTLAGIYKPDRRHHQIRRAGGQYRAAEGPQYRHGLPEVTRFIRT